MLKDRIDEILRRNCEAGEIAGANVLVLKDGEEVAYCEAGHADIKNDKPFSRDTIMRMYSQTKPITGAAVMLLVADGLIDYAGELREYMPEFDGMFVSEGGLRHEAVHPITIARLMGMTSGLPYPDMTTEGGRQTDEVFKKIDERLYSDTPVTTLEFAEMMSKTDLCFEPGSKFMYGTSADILGALVEKVSGMPFRDFLRQRLLGPLEMNDTDFYVPEEKQARLANVYDYAKDGFREVVTDNLGLRYKRDVIPAFQSGGAGLCSTIDDYAKFATMLLCDGEYKGRQVMPKRAAKFFTQAGRITMEKASGLHDIWEWTTGYTYANLMRVCEDESLTSVFSSKGEYGWDGWLGTFFSNEPKHGITFLFGTQLFDMGRSPTLVRKIRNVVMGELA